MRAPETDKSETDKSLSLFTRLGERKYLSAAERTRFYAALDTLDEASRTFCEMIYWTGCRPAEALAMTEASISVENCQVVIRSLKKRRALKGRHFRIVPLPRPFIERLAGTHGLSGPQGEGEAAAGARLWPFSRTTGWVRMAAVMQAAGISGAQACARGLRHSFGVNAALRHVPETRIQKWLGHANLATTAIYLDMAALEDREMAQRMWWERPPARDGPMPEAAGDADPASAEVAARSVTEAELLRLVSAYSAIPEAGQRLALLSDIETTAGRPRA